MLTPEPSSNPSPITADSGMPSRTIPSTIARAVPAPGARRMLLRSSPPIRSINASPTKKVRAPAESPRARLPVPADGLERFRDELVGDGADQDTGPERHDPAEPALPDREHEGEDSPEDERGAREQAPAERRSH